MVPLSDLNKKVGLKCSSKANGELFATIIGTTRVRVTQKLRAECWVSEEVSASAITCQTEEVKSGWMTSDAKETSQP